jgi:hypothetical protein
MKMLLFLIFTGFCSGSFAVNTVPVEKEVHYFKNIERQEFSNRSGSDQRSQFYAPTKHLDRYVISKYRHYSPARYSEGYLSLRFPAVQLGDNFFVASYSYCKTIGLFLIFPQHYFW